jgi:hypothetical protein
VESGRKSGNLAVLVVHKADILDGKPATVYHSAHEHREERSWLYEGVSGREAMAARGEEI